MRSGNGFYPLLNGYLELLFPKTCICCGHRMAEGELYLCGFCKYERFEAADSSSGRMDDEILPEDIVFRMALWQLEPGGNLQRIMHSLKYGRLYGLGVDMGMELGRLIRRKIAVDGYEFRYEPLLVPVPLHRRSYRKRGYNQAAAICEGMAGITGWSILDSEAIIRFRNTRSQTGLDYHERLKNVTGVFKICKLDFTPYELPVVVDDVYTTGATSLELCRILKRAGAQKAGIATLAEV